MCVRIVESDTVSIERAAGVYHYSRPDPTSLVEIAKTDIIHLFESNPQRKSNVFRLTADLA